MLAMPFLTLVNAVLANDALRGLALKVGEKKSYNSLVEKNDSGRPRRVQEDKYYMLKNMLHSIDRALENRRVSPSVRRGLIKILVGSVLLADNTTRRAFEETHGFDAPTFLLISPTKRCNLHCIGCYASSSSANAEKLDYNIVDRILTEKRELWGSHFTVISGGEPLMWKSDGKDLIDIVAKHNDQFFLMYTNGTLIDEKMAQRMAEAGNITPAISVEGFEKETDARRGKGVHKRILKAFENLRNSGVPFGLSITAMRDNAEFVLSDEFMDFYFEEQGAGYGWIFQYMPIGRSYTLDLMVTPEQRKWMFEREQHLIREKTLFIADFWNSGAVSNGCIAGGRPGGYFYIDWNGNCLPCAFYPYTVDNIKQVYQEGGDLNTILMNPFFQAIREWQRDYSYMKPAHEVGNQIVPCISKDHHREARKIIDETEAKPADREAEEALKDPAYYRGLVACGDDVNRLTRPIWENEYIGPERERVEKEAEEVKIMEEKESQVTRTVREAVVKAAEKGEDLKTRVAEITRDAVKKALEKTEPTREKVEAAAKDAVQGAIEGAKETEVEAFEVTRQAAEGVVEGTKQAGAKAANLAEDAAEAALESAKRAGDKAVEAAKDALKGLIAGTKDVLKKKEEA
jgi:MoaA/NifB/PqqE/SkfB family radical SAM enzyme